MDIVFFAAVAFFIFLKLRKQLGQVDEEEKRNIEQKLVKSRAEFMAMQQRAAEQAEKSEKEMRVVNPIKRGDADVVSLEAPKQENIPAINEAVKNEFVAVLSSCKINPRFFIDGTKMAFEMVIKAFAAGDLEVLHNLLSEKIYQNFVVAINERKSQSQTLVTNLISINKVEIVSAAKIGNIASIAVEFVSQQINYIADSTSQIVKGRKDQINEINDVWTFEKDVTSSNPNWIVTATHS